MTHHRTRQRPVSRRSRAVSLTAVAAVVAALLSVPALPAAAADAPEPTAGALAGWGNISGIDYGATPSPVPSLPGGVGVSALAAGFSYALALGADGAVYAWGYNDHGQLGTGQGSGSTAAQSDPARVLLPDDVTVVSVAAAPTDGHGQGLAVTSDGAAYVWGTSDACHLGASMYTPVPLTLPTGVHARQAVGGIDNTYILGDDGNVYATGPNTYGQLGTGEAPSAAVQCTPVPVALPNGVTATAIAANYDYALAAGSDGHLYSWGLNAGGQLGTGSGNASSPVRVQLPAGVGPVSISAGSLIALASGTDGHLYAWGANYGRQLGDGTRRTSLVPVQTSLPAGVSPVAISAGGEQSFALGSDGYLYAWGDNSLGQLGDGTTAPTAVPVRVALPKDGVLAVASGGSTFGLAVVNPVTPQFVQASPPGVVTAGATLSYTFAASGFPAPTYALAPGAPSWLSIDPVSGALTGIVPNGVSAFSFSVTATNSAGTATAGPFVGSVPGASARVSGTVVGPSDLPVNGAIVDVCASDGSVCQHATTGPQGGFSVIAAPDSTVVVTAYPPPDSTLMTASTGRIAVGATDVADILVTLSGSTLPDGVTVTSGQAGTASGGEPKLNWSQGATVTVTGCPDGTGMMTLVGQNNLTGQYEYHLYSLTETAQGSGVYTGAIPPQYPVHGPVTIRQTVACAGQVGVQPQYGLTAGGASVMISGSGFGGATAVRFGSAPAQNLQRVSDDLLMVTAPVGTGPVAVVVTLADGSTVNAGTYTFLLPEDVPDLDMDSYQQANGVAGFAPMTTVAGYGFAGTSPERSAFARTLRPTDSAPDADQQYLVPVTKWVFNHFPGGAAGALRSAIATAVAAVQPTCDSDRNALKAAIHLYIAAAVAATIAAVSPSLVIGAEAALSLLVDPIVAAILAPTVTWIVKSVVGTIINKLADSIIDAAIDALLGPCPRNDHKTNMLIDPSGTVLDTNGNPIAGATVTILRSDTETGTYTSVDVDQPGIEPATNPEVTGTDGVFHWDVRSGWYDVRAVKAECTVPGHSDEDTAATGPLPVPPPQVGLTITMQCPGEAPAPTPVVTGLTVTTGPPGGGTDLIVTGSGFTPGSTVTVGGDDAPDVTYLGTTGIEITTPAHASGPAHVVVHAAGGGTSTSDADVFTYGAAPAITEVSPSQGPVAAGTVVTITGSGFTGATVVGFGGVPGTGLTVDSDTQLTVTTPAANAVGPVDVVVVTPIGAGSAAFAYTADTGDTGGTGGTGGGDADGPSGGGAPAGGSPQTSSVPPATGTTTPATGTTAPATGAAGSGAGDERAVVTLDESTVAAGGTVTVDGSGFVPGEQVRATLHSTPIDLGSRPADPRGRVRFVVTIPIGLTSGAHHITLTGEGSGRVATVALTTTGPLAAPALADTGTRLGAPLLWALLALLIGTGLILAGQERRTGRRGGGGGLG